ncbi:hypothetical protein [Neoaquamicrobium sediminum]|uniref:GcrA cell cycle regulator n=2 Tax=root TaxID=1 RepID=A0AB38ZLH1_9VIRU
MRALSFVSPVVKPERARAPLRRSIFDMVAGLNAPVAPDGDPAGWALADLDAHECRFPIGHPSTGVRFCAAVVSADDWRPGAVNGCYCRFHRDYLRGQPPVTEDGEG